MSEDQEPVVTFAGAPPWADARIGDAEAVEYRRVIGGVRVSDADEEIQVVLVERHELDGAVTAPGGDSPRIAVVGLRLSAAEAGRLSDLLVAACQLLAGRHERGSPSGGEGIDQAVPKSV